MQAMPIPPPCCPRETLPREMLPRGLRRPRIFAALAVQLLEADLAASGVLPLSSSPPPWTPAAAFMMTESSLTPISSDDPLSLSLSFGLENAASMSRMEDGVVSSTTSDAAFKSSMSSTATLSLPKSPAPPSCGILPLWSVRPSSSLSLTSPHCTFSRCPGRCWRILSSPSGVVSRCAV